MLNKVNNTALWLTFALVNLVEAADDFCSLGWPAVVGPASQDGETSVTIWSETPDKNAYLIGGNSNSEDFTEESVCTKSGGCAYLANWNRISQKFDQKWVFTDANQVVDIKFEPYTSIAGEKIFAIVFANKTKKDKDFYESKITFNTWSSSRATLSTDS